MKSETMMVVTPQGVERWDINKTLLDVGPQIAERFASNIVRKIDRAIFIGGSFGYAGIATSSAGDIWWTVEVKTLTMNAPFAVKNGVLVPSFEGESANMKMEWQVPEGMKLLLSVNTQQVNTERCRCDCQYLHAFDEVGMSYRLPVSNVYEDCRLCCGQFDSTADNHAGSLKLALDQFTNASWNKDLYGNIEDERLKTECMFRFLPKNDGLAQLPMALGTVRHWNTLCTKVANDVTNNYVTL